MAVSQVELAIEIKKSGNRLFKKLPTRVDDLIKLLDQLEGYLAQVDQLPSVSMQKALAPSMKGLVSSELMHHSDEDVRVAVASCISEITRITAPKTPYDDEQMKGIYHLIVSSFDKLSDISSRLYVKRTLILETLSKVRSSVVMLDIDCDALIIEMFQIFFREIREYHPEDVCSSMETIMTLVLEESEDISLELLSPILAAVKKVNMDSARRMGEKVLQQCATKISPFLTQSMKSLESSLDEYSLVVANICKGTAEIATEKDLDTSGEYLVNESKLGSGASSTEAAQACVLNQVDKVPMPEVVPLQDADFAGEASQKPVISNGVEQPQDENALVDPITLNIAEHSDRIKQLTSDTRPSIATHGCLDTENIIMSDVKVIDVTRISGRKRKPSMKIADESLDTSGPRTSGRQKKSKLEEPIVSAETASKKHCEVPRKPGRPKKNMIKEHTVSADIDAKKFCEVSIDSPKPSESLRGNSRQTKAGRPEKSLLQEPTVPVDTVPMKFSEGSIEREDKTHELSGKKASGTPNEDANAAKADTFKENSATVSLGIETASLEKGRTRSAVIDVDEEPDSLPRSTSKLAKSKDDSKETPKRNSKRGRPPRKEIVPDKKELCENVVGKRIQVWWPQDRMFYGGVIDSWDPVKKRHKVLYYDGDEESLNLKTERWNLIEADSVPISDSALEHGKIEASPKRGGGPSSRKSKVPSAKSGSKNVSKENDKSDVDESEDDSSIKSKDYTPETSTESADGVHRTTATLKKVGGQTSQFNKELEHTPSIATKAKGNSLQNRSEPSSNSTDEDVLNESKSSTKDTEGESKDTYGDSLKSEAHNSSRVKT